METTELIKFIFEVTSDQKVLIELYIYYYY